jgi:hypothetical protein
MTFATKISRHAVHDWNPRRAPGRDRSSLKELHLWISFDARFLKDTLSRHLAFIELSETLELFPTLGARPETYQLPLFRQWSVERKGIEPLTPGLQSRCSPS